MEIFTFGTRGSHCVSGEQFNKYGGQTSCICIKTESFWIIFDSGMGIVEAGKKIIEDNSKIKNIFIFLSHLHNDHIEGMNFFAPLHIGSYKIKICGFAESSQILLHRIATNFEPPYFPLALGELKGQLETLCLSEREVLVFDDKKGDYSKRDVFKDEYIEGDFAVSNWYHPSHPKNGSLIFKLKTKNHKTYIYATDIELYGGGRDRKVEKLCKDCEVAFIDAQYSDEKYFNVDLITQGYGHSYHSAVIELGKRANIKKLRFFHHDPASTDEILDEVDKKLKAINKEWGCAYIGEKLSS